MEETLYFSSSGTDASTSTGDGARFTSSRTRAVQPSDGRPKGPPPKDYWFGQKFFECLLAQDILLFTAVQEPASAIDSKLSAAARDFPFSQCLEYLRSRNVGINNGLSDANPDPRQALLSQIGMIVRQGLEKEKRLVLHAIRKFKTGKAVQRQREDAPSDISRYTTLLKEYSDHIGEAPKYTSEDLPQNPQLFKQCVRLGGVKGEGTGKTIKAAKHQASKEACQHLGLRFNRAQ